MGLEASIAKVFQRAMESDLELIAQNVSADTSSNTTPQGSCMCACNISASVIRNTRERPEKQLYSVQQIVFRPVKDFLGILEKRIEEASAHRDGHGPHLKTLGALLKSYPSKRGEAKLLVQNQILSLISVFARHYQDEGPYVTIVVRPKVITLGVVDYVLKTLSRSAKDKLVEKNELRLTDIPVLERWPEEVVIGTKVYHRADLAVDGDSSSGGPSPHIQTFRHSRRRNVVTVQNVVEEVDKRQQERTRRRRSQAPGRTNGHRVIRRAVPNRRRRRVTRAPRRSPASRS